MVTFMEELFGIEMSDSYDGLLCIYAQCMKIKGLCLH